MAKRSALFLSAFIPACILAFLAYRYSVNVIYWDGWDYFEIFKKLYETGFNFSDLLSQNVESRPFFPRIVIFALSLITHSDVRYEMAFSIFLICLTSFGLYRIMRSTLDIQRGWFPVILLAVNALLFSPAQGYNVLTGHQIVVFMHIACIIGCFAVAYSQRLKELEKHLICLALCVISTFSMAGGILSWFLIFPVLLLRMKSTMGRKVIIVSCWAAAFLCTMAVYFYKYVTPSIEFAARYAAVLVYPGKAITYFLTIMGLPFSLGYLAAAAAAGLFILFMWTSLSAHLLWTARRDAALLYRAVGWIMIGSYTIITGLMTTLGRFGFSVDTPFPLPRYTTFSSYLIISLIGLMALSARDLGRGRYIKKLLLRASVCFVCIGYIFLFPATFTYGIKMMGIERVSRLKSKACLSFINVMPDTDALATEVSLATGTLAGLANFADNLGYINPPLIKSRMMSALSGIKRQGSDYGDFNNLEKVDGDTYIAWGWSHLPERNEPADLIILAYENRANESIMFKTTLMTTCEGDAKKRRKESANIWKAPFSKKDLPGDAVRISAWAYNALTGKAYWLNNYSVS